MSEERHILKLFDPNLYHREQLSLYIYYVPYAYLIKNDKQHVTIEFVQFDVSKALGLIGTVLN